MSKVFGLIGLMLAVTLALLAASQFGTFQSQGSAIAGPVGSFFALISGLWMYAITFLGVIFAIIAVLAWTNR